MRVCGLVGCWWKGVGLKSSKAWQWPALTTPTHPTAGAKKEEDLELVRAIEQLAELALLGSGRAADMYPATLEEMYDASLDEAPFRVVL